jgi:hypothetical protein
LPAVVGCDACGTEKLVNGPCGQCSPEIWGAPPKVAAA